MTATLKQKLDAAIEALKALHEDTSGPARQNLEAVETLMSEAETILDALKGDSGNE